MPDKSHNFKGLEKEERMEKLRCKFKQIREYAISKDWLLVEDNKETEEDYPSALCLTPTGILIDVSIGDDGLEIDNNFGDYTFRFEK